MLETTACVFQTASQVRQRYGGISDMTLWRWLHDPEMRFPQPRRINGRRFFSAADLDAFDTQMAASRVEAA
jgi:predicted DNA-binding transcriptional regulator AlpA